jgi:hypothetical protein
MGVVEDVRKVLQNLVTPEMRALAVETKSLREDMGRRFEELRADMDHRFEEVNRRFDYLERTFRLDERIPAVEDRLRKPAKRTAKEN